MTSNIKASPIVLPTSILPIPADDACGPRGYAVPEIQVALSGAGRRWLEIDGQHREVKTSPNMVEIYGSGYEIRRTRWLGREGKCVAIQISTSTKERFFLQNESEIRLRSLHEVSDLRVAHLCRELGREFLHGFPNGMLFSEGLSIALMGLLLHRYGGADDQTSESGAGLTAVQRRRIADYIEGELGTSLHIASLAALVGLSPSQFSRKFKWSFGLPPHQYILKRRLEVAASELQSSPKRSIADLAFSLGFSSQAHFTQAYRRHTGQTPTQLREHH